MKYEKNETGYHEAAKNILCEWVSGRTEVPFYVESKIAFVCDVVTFDEDRIKDVYEIIYSHPITGRKLGLMQAYAYLNGTGFSVFEVSADWVLKQTRKPERIETIELYEINPLP